MAAVDEFLGGSAALRVLGEHAKAPVSVAEPSSLPEPSVAAEELGALSATASAATAAAVAAACRPPEPLTASDVPLGELIEQLVQHVALERFGEAMLLFEDLVATSHFALGGHEVDARSGVDLPRQWWASATVEQLPDDVSQAQLRKLGAALDTVAAHYKSQLLGLPASTAPLEGGRDLPMAALFALLPPHRVWRIHVQRRRMDLRSLASTTPRTMESFRQLAKAVVTLVRADAPLLTGAGEAGLDGLHYVDVASLPELLDELYLKEFGEASR